MLPLVAVPGHRSPRAERFRTPVVAAGDRYLEAVVRAGAVPVVVPPASELAGRASELLDEVDGLLLLGGGDVDPGRYDVANPERHPAVYDVQPDLDAFETACLLAAIDRGAPVLAICRGAQLLNVALGGTLHQHITDTETTVSHRGARHEVDVVAGSLLADLLGVARAEVHSSHHQAIDRVAAGLVVTARADDGVVEAVEVHGAWVLGVQWHPEDSAADDPVQQRLFDGLTAEASRRCRRSVQP